MGDAGVFLIRQGLGDWGVMDYISRSCDFPKRKFLMAYISNFLMMKMPKK